MFKATVSVFRTLPTRTFHRILANGVLRRQFNSSAVKKGKSTTISMAVAAIGGFAYQVYSISNVQAEAPPEEIAEDRKAKVSAQHLQIKNSWEHPGVYAWGSNSGKVVAPDSEEDVIKSPRRMKFFDNILLRDLKLGRNIGVAVTEDGDVLQWGISYDPSITKPEKTLQGKNIVKVVVSDDRIFALSKDGKIYSLPQSKKLQEEGEKPVESSWVPGASTESPIHYRMINPELGTFETVKDLSSGLDHLLILTSNGRVFTAAASSTFPTRGQLGILGLTFATRPANTPYDVCHELTSLKPATITQIASGDYHSILKDSTGKVWVFGDNTSGQLGFEYNPESNVIPVPTLLPLNNLYADKSYIPKVTKIAAGGANTFFLVDVDDKRMGRIMADVFACGTGIWGNLGNGKWTHVQAPPTKIKILSGLYEFDDKTNNIVPIRIKELSVGATHTSVVMDNLTYVDASTAADSKNTDVNYGSDVLWWGNNEFYQLGTGKRNNACIPVYINPLDPVPEEFVIKDGMTGSSSAAEVTKKRRVIGGAEVGKATAELESDQVHRLQVAPKKKVDVAGVGVRVIEQRVVCGRGCSGVYSGV